MPILIIPSESFTREFRPKLLLACVAAEKGFEVVVGSRASIHNRIHRFPQAIYLAKDIRFSSRKIFSILRQLGHHIAAWDEEGVLYYSRETYFQARVDAATMAAAELLFAWGPDSAEVLASAPGYAGAPIHATGNPRVDMMRTELRPVYDDEVRALRERFGEFILINTNFGRLNHYLPGRSIVLPTGPGDPGKNIGRNDLPAPIWAYRKELFDAFRTMVPELAGRLPHLGIVIRPHPAENQETWRSVAAGCSNVTVVHEGNVVPWLLAARAMIHNGCTTGMEASILGTPAFTFQPIPRKGPELPLTNTLSQEVRSTEDLVEQIGRVLAGSLPTGRDQSQEALIRRYIAALDGPLASDRIAEVLVRWSSDERLHKQPPLQTRARGILRSIVRATSKRVQSLQPSSRHSPALRRYRFKELSVEEVAGDIAALRTALGRFEGVEATALAPDILRLKDRRHHP